jgi:hypothetical protein
VRRVQSLAPCSRSVASDFPAETAGLLGIRQQGGGGEGGGGGREGGFTQSKVVNEVDAEEEEATHPWHTRHPRLDRHTLFMPHRPQGTPLGLGGDEVSRVSGSQNLGSRNHVYGQTGQLSTGLFSQSLGPQTQKTTAVRHLRQGEYHETQTPANASLHYTCSRLVSRETD